ncbi:MAG: hypothetical protein E4H14_08830 [Candidatus Thorarchaeota archaeon]|nr:MAG: hypothetical protein E4H14_08830 [Candidatus Thorarchaeota archaeon]
MKDMLNSNKLMDRFFRRVDGVVWDLMSGRVGVRGADGITTIEGEGDDAQIVLNLFDQFGMEVPAFAQSTPSTSVTVGDLIVTGDNKRSYGWVLEKKEKSFIVLRPDGTRTNWSPPKVQMFGLDSGVMVVRSLLNILPGGNAGLGNMQSMLMPMLMMGDGAIDLEAMMPMMLMSQVGTDPANPTGGANNMGNMMQMMMMMQLFKRGGGSGRGGNFFDRS